MWLFFALSMIMFTLAVLYMLQVLPARGVPNQVKVVVGYAWFVTLMICCIVPIDVYSTLASKNPPAIAVLWDISYWSTQLLTWLLIPIYMGYADAGEFTWRERMWASLKSNAFFYVLMVAAGALGLFWAVSAGKLSMDTLPSLGMQLANTFGLFCVLALLGFGLVALPRLLLKRARPEAQLRHQLYSLGRVMEEKAAAQQQLSIVLRKVHGTKRSLGNSETDSHQRIQDMLDFIRDHLSDVAMPDQTTALIEDGIHYTDDLPKLHKHIKKDVYWIGAINKQADMIVQEACHLTDVVRASRGEMSPTAPRALEAGESSFKRVAWTFEVFALPWLWWLAAWAAAALSAVILWCEVTVAFDSDLSPLSLMVRGIEAEFLCQMMIMLPMLYVITCTYTAFFAINVGSLYALTPTASSSFSLLFNATMVARFAAPLCFNYLHVLCMDRATADGYYTVFAARMGLEKGDVVAIPFLGTSFNRWAPILIIAVVALTWMNAFGRTYQWLSDKLGFLPETYKEDDDDEFSESNQRVAEGRRVVDRAMAQRAPEEQRSVASSSNLSLLH